MKSELSSLVDGEIEPEASARIIDALRRDKNLQEAWRTYHLVGDALRRHPIGSPKFAEDVMSRLEKEPVVLARPAKRPVFAPFRFAFPLAAALAGMGVVGWVALSLNPIQPAVTASAPSMPQETKVALPAAQGEAGGLKEYLMAHQAHSANKGIQGVAPYVRTVSEVRQGARP
ncbi:MAG: anti-sigma 24 factor [Betaproteobacteria bacterium]|nr:anti-sigma 24 factor [Betaproteobacteria bacterium]